VAEIGPGIQLETPESSAAGSASVFKTQELSLARYAVRRLLQAFPLMLAVIVFTFFTIQLFPGDVAEVLGGPGATAEYYQLIRQLYGLDRPIHEQFIIYLTKILQGDFGTSLYYSEPVRDIIADKIPATLLLMSTQFIIASTLGVVLGAIAAARPGSGSDRAVIASSVFWYSIPVFWSGQILLYVFALELKWLPSGGMVSSAGSVTGLGYILDILRHLALPAVSLALFNVALISRITRSSTLEALHEDYIVTALAKGATERTVVVRHALRNALPPVLTVIGMNLGTLLGGAVLTETVFAWPGIGSLMFQSIGRRDYPVLTGIFLTVSLSVILANMFIDVLYARLDPRVRYK
jgi:peptide/nickel transport system permease protein